jgi:hypothetical protein
MAEVGEPMSRDHVILRYNSSGGSIICCTQDVPYNQRMREYLKVCTGITCTPENSTRAYCNASCECGCTIYSTNDSIVLISVVFLGAKTCSCVCHEEIMFISKRSLCFGTCLVTLPIVLASVNVSMLLVKALVKDDLPHHAKEVEAYVPEVICGVSWCPLTQPTRRMYTCVHATHRCTAIMFNFAVYACIALLSGVKNLVVHCVKGTMC